MTEEKDKKNKYSQAAVVLVLGLLLLAFFASLIYGVANLVAFAFGQPALDLFWFVVICALTIIFAIAVGIMNYNKYVPSK